MSELTAAQQIEQLEALNAALSKERASKAILIDGWIDPATNRVRLVVTDGTGDEEREITTAAVVFAALVANNLKVSVKDAGFVDHGKEPQP